MRAGTGRTGIAGAGRTDGRASENRGKKMVAQEPENRSDTVRLSRYREAGISIYYLIFLYRQALRQGVIFTDHLPVQMELTEKFRQQDRERESGHGGQV